MSQAAIPTNRTLIRILVVITLYATGLILLYALHYELILLAVAGFLALALNPLVNRINRKLPGGRGISVAVVFAGFLILLVAMAFVFIPPLVNQTQTLIRKFPQFSNTLQTSENILAVKARQYDLVPLIRENQDKITGGLSDISGSAVEFIRIIFQSLVATLTVLVFSIFMLLYGPRWVSSLQKHDQTGFLNRHSKLIARMTATVSGYVNGNLLTSLVAAVATSLVLTILGVPFAVPLGLLVGLFDLVPLIGATVGAVFVIIACLFHSVAAAIIMIVFFAIYQQFENHVLQPYVYSRTVELPPFLVLIAALAGARLGGLIGALVAIPIAANIQILAQEWLRLKETKTKA